MPKDILDDYWLAITAIEAQDMLLKLKIADWPNMKRDQRSKLHHDLTRQAYPWRKQTVTPSELAVILNE